VASFVIIHPQDDASAQQASDWGNDFARQLVNGGHTSAGDVDQSTPATAAAIAAVLRGSADLVCYFGHGDEDSWLTNSSHTIDSSNVHAAVGKPVVSIACKTTRRLGPDAITAGVISWLGFSISVAVIAPHKHSDPIGEAIVGGLAYLGNGVTMQQARDEIAANLDQLVADFDNGGKHASHPAAALGYFAAMSMRDHLVVQGHTACVPLP
jgi:hypothetical protein